jgi:fumarylacetoacetate (FAA) hydrolase
MKLATLDDGTRDGRLAVLSSDAQRFATPGAGPRTLQAALDDWQVHEAGLRRLAADLEADRAACTPLDPAQLLAPLPRAYEWLDGSAYLNHVRLARLARGAEPPPRLDSDPLVYQGGSSVLLGARRRVELPDEAWGLDFEAELCVVLGDTPRGVTADGAQDYVKLLMLCNDVTLRNLIPAELAKSFGFFQSKPASAFSPFAVTPDELGEHWRDGRLDARVVCTLNGLQVGSAPTGAGMHFSFCDLLAHLARTRAFGPGTIIGSGTVSSADPSAGACCIAEIRARETIARGAPETPFLKRGDRVTIDVRDESGTSLFGAIEQEVVST